MPEHRTSEWLQSYKMVQICAPERQNGTTKLRKLKIALQFNPEAQKCKKMKSGASKWIQNESKVILILSKSESKENQHDSMLPQNLGWERLTRQRETPPSGF